MGERSIIPSVSLVIPVYNEEKVLPVLMARLEPLLARFTSGWEIVFVDDGSRDSTLHQITLLAQQHPQIRILSFSRNFGQQAAVVAGLHHARYQVVIPMDADLQDPPELITEMIAKWQDGYDVVLATRRSRAEDTHAKRFFAEKFYTIFNVFATTPIPANTCYYRLMDKKVLEAVKKLPNTSRFLRGALAWVGFKTTAVYFDREKRAAGMSGWTAARLLHLALEGFYYYAAKLLRGWSLISLAFGFWCLFAAWVGIASSTTITLGIGILLIQVAIGNETHFRTLQDLQHRPEYIIAHKIGFE
jgi:glycosyltransferase involved in cell wall biosynthesis